VYERGETAHFEIVWAGAQLKGLNLQQKEPVILDVTIFPIKDTQGKITNAVIQHIDITERRRAEEALRANEYKFRRFVEESIDGLLLIDEQGKVIEWNRNLELLTGMQREEMLGQYMWDVQFQLALEERRTPALYENLKVQIKEALRTGDTPLFDQPVDVTIRCADGTLRTIHQSIYPIKTDRGFWIGATVRDASKSKPVEPALRQGRDDLSAADDHVESYPSE
jgi:PAS domain S-box-containing protein